MEFDRDLQAAHRIEQFLDKYPVGRLHVTTGYMSIPGLGWLAERSAGRPVTVVVGDLRKGMKFFTSDDAHIVSKFVERSDVTILNWYRTQKNVAGAAVAHGKVFAVEGLDGLPVAVLAGSADLSKQGLLANVESMVEAVPEDRDKVFRQIVWLEERAWDASDRVMERAKSRLPPPPPIPPPPAIQIRQPSNKGCLQAMKSAGLRRDIWLGLLGKRR